MRAEREDWFEAQDELDPDSLVFLDETATTTNMVRRYGWAPRGERCRVAVPHGHWKTTTVTAALRTSGVVATALFDGATNGQRFRAYVTDTLVPVLKRGDTVIMDNLAAHKVAGVRDAIQAVGARVLYLPPYSPDFNPIEQVFAKLKADLRKNAARTLPDLKVAIRSAFNSLTPKACRNCLSAAGYDAYDPTRSATALGRSFHGMEGGQKHWTDGNAVLPASLWEGARGEILLELKLGRTNLQRWRAPRGQASVPDAAPTTQPRLQLIRAA